MADCGGGGGELATPGGALVGVGGGLADASEELAVVSGNLGTGVDTLGEKELPTPPAPLKWT